MGELALFDLINICPVCEGTKKKPQVLGPSHVHLVEDPSAQDCSHCQGRGMVPTPSGKAVLDFLDHMRKPGA